MSESRLPDLSLSDLEISGIEVQSLNKEEFVGVPELGASFSLINCSTVSVKVGNSTDSGT